MNNGQYRPRFIDTTLKQYLQTFGAVCIEGPRFCGKTWTSRYHAASVIDIGDSVGNFQNRTIAQLDPAAVLNGAPPRLIDEWQEVPSIWDAVRHAVDQNPAKGQFILTGSAAPNHKGILQSGEGRTARLRIRTMSLFESGDSTGLVSLEQLCKENIQPVSNSEINLSSIISLILRGGWPAGISMESDNEVISKDYLDAVIDDDVYRLDGVKRDMHKIKLLLRSLARSECTTVSNKTLQNDVKAKDDTDVDSDTIAVYLNILKRLFLTDNIPSFASHLRTSVRIKQSEKRHLCDPSLACALLNASQDTLMSDLRLMSSLFESLCLRDLLVYAESFGAKVYHYQDYNNREIDAVVELSDGSWSAFEIKLGAHQIDEAAENLVKIKKSLESDVKNPRLPSSLCVLCGMANSAYRRNDGVFVVPITALRD